MVAGRYAVVGMGLMADDREVLGRDYYLEVIAYCPDVFGYNYTFGRTADAAVARDRD